jgi:hypothetical protein
MKRFQECNRLGKMWRYRFYIPIPFKYLWFMYIKSLVVRETALNVEKEHIEDTGEIYNPTGKNLWRLLIGSAQCDMNWTYTQEEVMGKLKKYEK